jgi:hypothetical protein
MKISKNDFKIIFRLIINSTEPVITQSGDSSNDNINILIKKYDKKYILELINKINLKLTELNNVITEEKKSEEIINEINTTTDIDSNYPFISKKSSLTNINYPFTDKKTGKETDKKTGKQEIAKFFSKLKEDIKELKKVEVNITETIESLNSEIEQLNESKNKLQTYAATFRNNYETIINKTEIDFKKFLAKLKD